MEKMTINGCELQILNENVEYNGRSWYEINFFPIIKNYVVRDGRVFEEAVDWIVMKNEDFVLYENNEAGFVVLIEFQKWHFDEEAGKCVTDKVGRILFSYI